MNARDIPRRLFLGSAVGALALKPSRTAQADTPFTNFSFAAKGAPTARTMPDRLNDVINVKDWGAFGNNSHNDTTAIQNAIDFCISRGGGKVFFPQGQYLISSPLVVGHNSLNVGVQLIGCGKDASTFARTGGYSDPNGFDFEISKGNKIFDCIERIEGLGGPSVKATRSTVSILNYRGGRIDVADAIGASVRNCWVSWGSIGAANSASPGIPTGAGTIGIALGTASFASGCRVLGGAEIAFALSGSGAAVVGCSAENNKIAVRVGWKPGVGESPAHGASVQQFQTERCEVGIDLYNCTAGLIAGNTITGTEGLPDPPGPISRMVWSAGTVTVTTSGAHNLPAGVTRLRIDANPTSYNPPFPGGIKNGVIRFADVTRTGSTTFTYSLAANPSASFVSGAWNYPLQYGIRCRKVYETSIIGNEIVTSVSIASVDLDYGGAAEHRNNLFAGAYAYYGWQMPSNTVKTLAGWKFINLTGELNFFGEKAAGPTGAMHFADLPGQSGVFQDGPFETQEYNIVDSPVAALGNFAANVTAGGGSNRVKVRWDGKHWKMSG
jgi:Pectate lyase superfamily protein